MQSMLQQPPRQGLPLLGPGNHPMDESTRTSHVSCALARNNVVGGDSAGGPAANADTRESVRNGTNTDAPLKPPALGGGGAGTCSTPSDMPTKQSSIGNVDEQAADRQ